MAYIHVNVGDELHRLVKATAATRGESIKAALTRMCWWYVDGTDYLLLDVCDDVLHGDMPRETARLASKQVEKRAAEEG